MIILVINCGSSSLKYQLLDMKSEQIIAKGICERIGIEGGTIGHKIGGGKLVEQKVQMCDHTAAFGYLLDLLCKGDDAVLSDVSQIDAVGHRVVHGGSRFSVSCLLTEEVITAIEQCNDLAPLHNPANVQGIRCAFKVLGNDTPQVAVFDTAFHQTMPAKAFMYALPYEYYEKYAVRRYGFHGTSHRFVSSEAAKVLGRDIKDLKLVVCHLGNGSSLCAVNGGESVDTTMGFSPLSGLMMGTRSGDVDPALITYLSQKEGISATDIIDTFNKKSGFLGVSGRFSDYRDLQGAANEEDERSSLAVAMLSYQIAKFIGGYAAAMNGIDAVVFTGGIGENGAKIRKNVVSYLGFLGAEIDDNKNETRSTQDISAQGARVKTLIIETNEELMIAMDTLELVK